MTTKKKPAAKKKPKKIELATGVRLYVEAKRRCKPWPFDESHDVWHAIAGAIEKSGLCCLLSGSSGSGEISFEIEVFAESEKSARSIVRSVFHDIAPRWARSVKITRK